MGDEYEYAHYVHLGTQWGRTQVLRLLSTQVWFWIQQYKDFLKIWIWTYVL